MIVLPSMMAKPATASPSCGLVILLTTLKSSVGVGEVTGGPGGKGVKKKGVAVGKSVGVSKGD